MCYCCLTQLAPPRQPSDENPLQETWQIRPTCNRKEGVSISVWLTTLNLHPRPTTAYAAMHSDDCYFGIMSICTVLNWGAVKSRLNTALSYHAILASVSIAKWVQIWCRAMEMSHDPWYLTSWLQVLFCFLFRLFTCPSLCQLLNLLNYYTSLVQW